MDEPSAVIRAIMWHLAGGDALWLGWGLVLAGLGLAYRGAPSNRVVTCAFLGLVWINVAAWPAFWPAWSLNGSIGVWLSLTAREWYVERIGRRTAAIRERHGVKQGPPWPDMDLRWRPTTARFWRDVTGLLLLLAIPQEVVWLRSPTARFPAATSLAVIGDSISAGLDEGEETWPRKLARTTGRTVYDASQQGATVASAAAQLERLQGRGDVLWLEIGGNDILESLPPAVFGEHLERLLADAREHYDRIVMMEIPAPPMGGAYGRIQRDLARRYAIPLVQKRRMMTILTTAGGTQDGIHLSDAGQERFTTLVTGTLGWPESSAPGQYMRIEE
jgi:lysophospholipase L1-like esterase